MAYNDGLVLLGEPELKDEMAVLLGDPELRDEMAVLLPGCRIHPTRSLRSLLARETEDTVIIDDPTAMALYLEQRRLKKNEKVT